MPANTSTPTAPRFEATRWAGSGWRAVEAQHKNATLDLAQGRLDDQALLESIIEEAKPALPADAVGLHFLLATPFRYRSPPPAGSRFRSRSDPGVFYGAEELKTACAEAGYWRLRFWMDSAGLAARPATLQMTLFEFHGATARALDLTRPPLVERRTAWIAPDDYGATQSLAGEARAEGIELIRYESARLGPGGRCLAILTPRVFKGVREPYRHEHQTWSLYLRPPALTVWQRQFFNDAFEISY
jgi:hypothetical protein